MAASRFLAPHKSRWVRILGVAFIMYILAYIDRTNISMAIPAMRAELGLTTSAIGFATGMFFWGYIILQVPAGRLAAVWSAKWVIFGLLMFWSIASFSTAFVRTENQLIANRFILGLFEGGVLTCTIVLIRKWFTRKERARANTLFLISIPLASVVSNPISGLVLEHFGWQMMFIVEALPGLVDLAKEKTGVFTGAFAINPVNGKQVPIWIADYVLASYGTGAIMAVPAHDLRDWEFAVRFELPIVPVVQPPAGYEPTREETALVATINGSSSAPFVGLGTAINSGSYDGTPTATFKPTITADLARAGLAREAVNYRLRDWLFSRQHYWGEPFPIWHELDAEGNPTGLLRTVPESELPLTLPAMSDFKPSGKPEPPLAKAPAEWLYRTDTDGTRLARETNTMPQWAGSCWYYLRFIDPKNTARLVDPEKEKYWMPVDLYVGGAEHAVLHLLYARFWHKVLFDRGDVSTPEPFQKLVNQGMILGEAELTRFQTVGGQNVPADEVSTDAEGKEIWGKTKEPIVSVKMSPAEWDREGTDYVRRVADAREPVGHRLEQRLVVQRTYKMSKSRGNVISPNTVVADYGADAMRLYEMFMGPLEATKPWSMSGVEGISRFLARVWRMVADERADDIRINSAVRDVPATPEQLRVLHRTIKSVTDDIEKMSFNTSISRLMEFTNDISQADPRPKAVIEPFVLLLSPLAPHLAEELWEVLGHGSTLAYEPWPAFDESLIAESEIDIPVQVNGKLRGKVRVPVDADHAAVDRAARADSGVAGYLSGKTIVKVVYVPGRLLNFVVK